MHEIKVEWNVKTIEVESEDDIPCFISEELGKLGFIASHSQIYEPITQYVKVRLADYAIGEKKA